MVQKKKILIDLGKLKNRYSGLGEICWNFGKTLSEKASPLKAGNIEFYFLVPSEFKGAFGNDVKYVTLNFFRRHFSFLNTHYDLWYAIHQDSGYMPPPSSKYLLTVNDLNTLYKSSKSKVEKNRKKIQRRINRSSYITTISRFGKEEVVTKLDTGKIPVEVIYPGVLDPNGTNAIQPGGIPGSFYFHISTIMEKKNVESLVDMMKLMPHKNLVIAGSWDNPYAKNILERIKKENIRNVITLSKVNENEKAWLYKNCEAFFFPSFLEGFGMPVIEAMYCGKPVFCSTYTSLPEVGSDKAFYWEKFEPGYMKEVVESNMERIKGDENFSQQLRSYASQFTWQKSVDRFIGLFKELL